MKTCFSFLRGIVSALLSLSLIIIISVGLYVYVISSVISTRDNFKKFISQTEITKNFIQNISSLLATSIPASTLELLNKNITDQVVSQNVDALVNNVYDWVENKTTNLNLNIPLLDDKVISRQFAFGILAEFTKDLPKCNKNYKYPESFEEFTCQPSPLTEQNAALTKIIDSQIQNVLPKDLTKIPIEAQTEKDIRHAFIIIGSLQNVMVIAIVVITILILIVTPGFPNGFKVAGTSLVASAGLTLLGNWILLNNQQIISALFPQIKISNLTSAVPTFLNNLINQFLIEVNRLAVIFLIIGILLWVIYFAIKIYKRYLHKKVIQQLPSKTSIPSVNQ